MTLVTEGAPMLKPSEALRRVFYLKSLPETAIDRLVAQARIRILRRGEILALEGEKNADLIVVLSGAVKVYKLDSRGRELTLDRETPGQSVLDLALFDGGNYPANAEAAADPTHVLVVGRQVFFEVVALYPQIAMQALKTLGVRMRKLIVTVEAQSLYSVRARLASYLLEVARGRDQFALTETNEEIGSRIGTVREVVSRSLHGFKDAGAITVNGRHITVADAALLRRIAGVEFDQSKQ